MVDSAADIYVCNDQALITEYQELPSRIGGSMSDGILTGRGKVWLQLALKNGTKGLVLNFRNFYNLPNSLCNLDSLGLLNNNGIFHENENETMFQVD